MTDVGKNILAARKRLGMTQEELAEKVGYKSKSAINKIELGVRDLPQKKIIVFAEALSTTPSVLMGWDDEEANKKNDAIAGAVSRMRRDPDFLDVVSLLAKLPPDQYASVKTILSALGNK